MLMQLVQIQLGHTAVTVNLDSMEMGPAVLVSIYEGEFIRLSWLEKANIYSMLFFG